MSDNCACSNGGACPDMHPRTDYRPRTNSNIIIQNGRLRVVCLVAHTRIFVVSESSVRANKNTTPNTSISGNKGPVLNSYIIAHNGAVADPTVGADDTTLASNDAIIHRRKLPHLRPLAEGGSQRLVIQVDPQWVYHLFPPGPT